MGRRFRRDRFSKSWWGSPGYWYRRPERGGVIGNSRIVLGRYQDEGDNGKAHRREIKRREKRLWRREAEEEV